ncbi:MAG: hypothetical protein JWM44_4380 [Bacilli bacterium]|nr:hypothetical protein [Bacilli bacterium]
MSIFKRIGAIIKSEKKQQPLSTTNSFEETNIGDVVTVDLEEYIVSGKVAYFDRGYTPHRYAYYLQNGKSISCLLVEKGRNYECFLCEFLEGALDDPNDVPTKLDIDGELSYELENHRTDVTRTEGNTDFRNGDDVLIWRYFSTEDRYFFLQWQDGKFIALQGSRTSSAQIQFMKASR